MHEVDFDEALDHILAQDSRYHRDAYHFLREALDHTQNQVAKQTKRPHHVTGQQLLGGIRDFALHQFGPMCLTVFEEWGLRNCQDFGEIVFNMVETGLLAKTETDSRADFAGGYDFHEAFRQPFLPQTKSPAPAPEAKPAGA